MRAKMLLTGVVLAVGIAFSGSAAAADAFVRAPVVTVQVGQQPPPPAAGGTIEVRTVPQAVVAFAPVAPISHRDFAKVFAPAAGTHKVLFLHPYKCCPVEVCFNLPCGCPKVKCDRNELEFDYGRVEVEVRFYRDGGVRVKYRD